jgi:hypothetical protein
MNIQVNVSANMERRRKHWKSTGVIFPLKPQSRLCYAIPCGDDRFNHDITFFLAKLYQENCIGHGCAHVYPELGGALRLAPTDAQGLTYFKAATARIREFALLKGLAPDETMDILPMTHIDCAFCTAHGFSILQTLEKLQQASDRLSQVLNAGNPQFIVKPCIHFYKKWKEAHRTMGINPVHAIEDLRVIPKESPILTEIEISSELVGA